jgi:hypothetical protein
MTIRRKITALASSTLLAAAGLVGLQVGVGASEADARTSVCGYYDSWSGYNSNCAKAAHWTKAPNGVVYWGKSVPRWKESITGWPYCNPQAVVDFKKVNY